MIRAALECGDLAWVWYVCLVSGNRQNRGWLTCIQAEAHEALCAEGVFW
jgi:hypothetical protein